MQRINWFPDPLITGTSKIETGNNAKIYYPVVNNRKWLRVISVAAGDSYGQYLLLGSQLPPAGTYHVHALVYAQKATADFQIYVRVAGTYRMVLNVPVGNGMTITIDQDITIPSNTDQLLIRIALDQKTVGAIGMMSDILIERADTYGTAVGGASGLLHRGHDATRLRRSVGRVMSDDGHEPVCDAALGLRFAAGRQHAYGVYGHGRRGLLFPRLGVLRWGHGEADDRRYDANLQPRRESHREIHAEIIESDCQHEGRVRRAESEARGLLRLRKLCAHDRRIPKVRDRGPLQREYDATRLTLMGVMA